MLTNCRCHLNHCNFAILIQSISLSAKADIEMTEVSCYVGRVMKIKAKPYEESDVRDAVGDGDSDKK